MFKNNRYYIPYLVVGLSLVGNFFAQEGYICYPTQKKEIRKNNEKLQEFDKEVYSFYKKIIGHHTSLNNELESIHYYTHYMSEKFIFELQFHDLYKKQKCQKDTVKLAESLVEIRRMYNRHLKEIFNDKEREHNTLNKEVKKIYDIIDSIESEKVNKKYLYEICDFVKLNCLSLYFSKTLAANNADNCNKEFEKIINLYKQIDKNSGGAAYIVRVQNKIADLYSRINGHKDKKFKKIKNKYASYIELIKEDNLELCLRSGNQYKLVLSD